MNETLKQFAYCGGRDLRGKRYDSRINVRETGRVTLVDSSLTFIWT